jgi:hypothetical protein
MRRGGEKTIDVIESDIAFLFNIQQLEGLHDRASDEESQGRERGDRGEWT